VFAASQYQCITARLTAQCRRPRSAVEKSECEALSAYQVGVLATEVFAGQRLRRFNCEIAATRCVDEVERGALLATGLVGCEAGEDTPCRFRMNAIIAAGTEHCRALAAESCY